jgi:hypothetical protein
MRRESTSRLATAGKALAMFTFVLAALALAACGGDEEEKVTPTATPVASPTATATAAVTATPQPSPTAEPTMSPSPTATVVAPIPSWQTSAPIYPVPAGDVVDLGIRNKYGAPGETYAIGVTVRLPDGSPVAMEGEVVGDEWTYFTLADTGLPGTYTAYFGLPQSDFIYAEAFFEVYAPEPPPAEDFTTLVWQTSAPRTPAAVGEVVELGLRNKFGEPGECYAFLIEVLDPLGDYASAEDTVCGDEWAYLTYENTFAPGTYDVYFSIEGQDIAQDFFEVGEG